MGLTPAPLGLQPVWGMAEQRKKGAGPAPSRSESMAKCGPSPRLNPSLLGFHAFLRTQLCPPILCPSIPRQLQPAYVTLRPCVHRTKVPTPVMLLAWEARPQGSRPGWGRNMPSWA